jgi:hypothetical protein
VSDFELLSGERKNVREFARLHAASVGVFHPPGRDWFRVHSREADSDELVRHRTTTATCIESLADLGAARQDTESEAELRRLATSFAGHALDENESEWESEGAAFVYCRVRTLPAILAYSAHDVVVSRADTIASLLALAWSDVSPAPRRQAVYERSTLEPPKDEDKAASATYPPNAFHTFWALRCLRLAYDFEALRPRVLAYEGQRNIALLWTQNVMASQVALFHAKSERADPHQLAWALAAQFVGGEAIGDLAAGEFARADIYRSALDAFFGQQLTSGSWPLGQPLFHYPRAGNAYCYTFETLAELLRPALLRRDGQVYRDLLRPHLPGLLKAWNHLRQTAVQLNGDGTAVGWRSGHHPHRVYPEGWATAAAFSFVQCLRRLLGMWTHDEAARALGVRATRHESRRKAIEELAERGQTWTGGTRWSAGEQVAALFLHPVMATAPRQDHEDPDLPLIDEGQARSAILFGPPGTSKTTLAEALAGAIGWDFVEVHASHFLSEGMDHVPGRADEIFSKLMELDHCVILFDEIDELLRERRNESDPFGRFLTTSMLPKVARLWAQRRVLFFVATNDITKADDAIQRSQRFDAAIFVAPPSFAVKEAKLRARLNVDIPFDEAAVEKSLTEAKPTESTLGFFALLRYDQIDEYADLVERDPASTAGAEKALREIGSAAADDPNPYQLFRAQQKEERRDHRTLRLLWAHGFQVEPVEGLEPFCVYDGASYHRIRFEPRPPPELTVDGEVVPGDGALRYQPSAAGEPAAEPVAPAADAVAIAGATAAVDEPH